MLYYNKDEIKQNLLLTDVFEILSEFGGNPEYTTFGVISQTICHNPVGEGSKKLYYYENSHLFHCYTGCANPSFDIFELIIKVADIQWNKKFELHHAVAWLANRLGISGEYNYEEKEELEDWKYITNYNRIQEIQIKNNKPILKEYDNEILNKFNYKVKIVPWLQEGINELALKQACIGYYPGGEQITIPHFNKDGKLIGVRGRSLCAEDAERYGKYRPLKINGILYNHPIGMNLYNLNYSKDNIAIMKKAIVVEGEKSSLQYKSYFGLENDITVACCGSSISSYQFEMLLEAGAQEIIIAFDRQFKSKGDDEFKKLKANLLKLRNRYKNNALISFIFDKNMITDYKASPLDHGPDIFLKLFKERIIL